MQGIPTSHLPLRNLRDVEEFERFPLETYVWSWNVNEWIRRGCDLDPDKVAVYFQEEMDPYFCRRLVMERLPQARTLDFIGLNYYTRDFVRNTGVDLPGLLGNVCTLEHHRSVGKRNDLGWEVYPEGLARFLRSYSRFRLPILITENGVPAVRDDDRWTFIYLHLWQVARAISEGVPVVGYLYWSLLDNFEWADGFGARFGLVGIDFETQERTVRESARRLARVIDDNGL